MHANVLNDRKDAIQSYIREQRANGFQLSETAIMNIKSVVNKYGAVPS